MWKGNFLDVFATVNFQFRQEQEWKIYFEAGQRLKDNSRLTIEKV